MEHFDGIALDDIQPYPTVTPRCECCRFLHMSIENGRGPCGPLCAVRPDLPTVGKDESERPLCLPCYITWWDDAERSGYRGFTYDLASRIFGHTLPPEQEAEGKAFLLRNLLKLETKKSERKEPG